MNTKNNLSFFECSTCAFRHFASAKLLSNEKYYDMAIGHLILGAEESIKALVYYSRTVDFLNIVELPGIFKDHSIKHKALAEIHTSWIELLEIFLKSINVFKDERNLLFEHISNNSNNDEAEIKKWWKKANKLKNTGWYVTESNGTLITPDRITIKEYNEAKKITLTLELSLLLLSKLREIELEKC